MRRACDVHTRCAHAAHMGCPCYVHPTADHCPLSTYEAHHKQHNVDINEMFARFMALSRNFKDWCVRA